MRWRQGVPVSGAIVMRGVHFNTTRRGCKPLSFPCLMPLDASGTPHTALCGHAERHGGQYPGAPTTSGLGQPSRMDTHRAQRLIQSAERLLHRDRERLPLLQD